jgi:hypothetical protein
MHAGAAVKQYYIGTPAAPLDAFDAIIDRRFEPLGERGLLDTSGIISNAGRLQAGRIQVGSVQFRKVRIAGSGAAASGSYPYFAVSGYPQAAAPGHAVQHPWVTYH